MLRNKKNSVLACRVCISPEKNNTIIMDAANGWLNLFSFCFGFKIHPQEQDRVLCKTCADIIKSFAILKIKCIESNKIWKSRLKTPQLKVEQKNEHVKMEKDNEENFSNSKVVNENNIVDIECDKNDSEKSNCYIEQLEDSDNVIVLSIDSGNLMKSEYSKENNSLQGKQENNTNKDSRDQSSKNDDNSNNDLKGIQHNTMNIFDSRPVADFRKELFCYCGLRFSNMHKNLFTKHILICTKWKFYNAPENQNDVLKMCGLCKFSTQDVEILCEHFNEHYNRNDLDCKLCDYIGQDFASMVYHRYTHLATENSNLFCLLCLKLLYTPKTLQFHFRVKHLKKEKGGLCGYCGAEFASVTKWRMHERSKHNDSQKYNDVYICDCCGITFMYRKFIVEHLRIRAGLCKVVCDECGKVFSCRRYLKRHKTTVHTNTRRVQCTNCPKFLTSSNLQAHMRNAHGHKNYVCEFCSAKYASLPSFKYHMLSHTNERPYKCDVCNSSYKKKALLTQHIMSKHTGERPFECKTCSRRFARASVLKVHNAVHTKKRRYQCTECDKSFYVRKILLRHFLKTHPGTVLPG